MEIDQYLRARPKRTAVALLLPLLAALLAFVLLQGKPSSYTASATVSVPESVASSASRIGVFVADFAEVAASPSVAGEVAQATGVPRREVEEGVEVTRIGQSSLFNVVYTGDEEDTAEPVVRAVVARSYARLVGGGVAEAENQLAAAEQDYQAAVTAREAYQDEIGTIQPDRDYADLSSRIRSIEANPGSGSVATLEAQRDRLVPQVRRAQELEDAVEAASSRRSAAERDAGAARSEAIEVQSPRIIRDLTVDASTSAGGLLQGVGVAAVAGLLCGLAVLVLPDLLRHRGTRGTPPPAAPGTTTPGTTTPAASTTRPTTLSKARDAR